MVTCLFKLFITENNTNVMLSSAATDYVCFMFFYYLLMPPSGRGGMKELLPNPIGSHGSLQIGRDPLSPTPSGVSFASLSGPRLVNFSPRQLLFPPPLDKIISNVLTIRSMESEVTWKLYHNAPHRYTVVPNNGILVCLRIRY